MAFRHMIRPQDDTSSERAYLFFVGDTIIIQQDSSEYLTYMKIEDVDSVEQIKKSLESIKFTTDNGKVPRSGDMFVRGSIGCVRTEE